MSGRRVIIGRMANPLGWLDIQQAPGMANLRRQPSPIASTSPMPDANRYLHNWASSEPRTQRTLPPDYKGGRAVCHRACACKMVLGCTLVHRAATAGGAGSWTDGIDHNRRRRASTPAMAVAPNSLRGQRESKSRVAARLSHHRAVRRDRSSVGTRQVRSPSASPWRCHSGLRTIGGGAKS